MSNIVSLAPLIALAVVSAGGLLIGPGPYYQSSCFGFMQSHFVNELHTLSRLGTRFPGCQAKDKFLSVN